MKATVVLLPSVEEQRAAGDADVIDPEVVHGIEGEHPLFADFRYDVPKDLMGQVTNVRVEDGRLVGDVEFLDRFAGFERAIRDGDGPVAKYGVSGIVRKYRLEHDPVVRVIEEVDLLSISAISAPPWPKS